MIKPVRGGGLEVTSDLPVKSMGMLIFFPPNIHTNLMKCCQYTEWLTNTLRGEMGENSPNLAV